MTSSTALLEKIRDTVTEMTTIMQSLSTEQINKIPYPGSWTAAQLCRHVYKSAKGVSGVMMKPSKQTERVADARAEELQKVFLNFDTKFQSPESIVPEEGPYEKEESTSKLKNVFEQLIETSSRANESEMIEGLPFGDATKLEVIHFILYHTQRHLHQLKGIERALKDL